MQQTYDFHLASPSYLRVGRRSSTKEVLCLDGKSLAAVRRNEALATIFNLASGQTERGKVMTETVPNHSPLAPAVSSFPPNDRRCTRAAGFPPRRLSPPSGDMASGTRPRPPFECIALLLQGGGALGAYQAGVYEAFTEADLHPDWIAGISIGAINGALIAGNAPEARVDKLRAFWERVTAKRYGDWGEHLFPAKGDAVRQWRNQMSANLALISGAAGFFTPRFPAPWLHPPGTMEATSFYDTSRLKATLEQLVDFDRINGQRMRLASGRSTSGAAISYISIPRRTRSARSTSWPARPCHPGSQQ
jgi:hypothetical protein